MIGNGETAKTLEKLRTLVSGRQTQLRAAGSFAAGWIFSAAALAGRFQPLALGLLCAAPPGWHAVLLALGGGLGYVRFWGSAGIQGAVWMAAGLVCVLLAGRSPRAGRQRLLIPALAALVVSGTGVVFQLRFADLTPVRVYLLRTGLAAASAAVFALWRQRRDGWTRWAVQAAGVLALARIRPFRYLGLGYAAAGLLGAAGSFPSAVMGGLALDLAGITAVRMTGAMCLGWCLRRIPGVTVWWGCLSPGVGFLLMAALSGDWDIRPLPALLLGGALAGMYPEVAKPMEVRVHAGEAAVAQVRLERMALALQQMEQSLAQVHPGGVDEQSLISRVERDACDSCPERRACRARQRVGELPASLLHQPGLGEEDLPGGCRKPARLLAALRRSQEQLRRICADRSRLESCREAVREQYGFLAEALRGVSDELAARREVCPDRFRPEVAVAARSAGTVNGDRCTCFAGPGNRYFVLLCDGMGTGEAAARESREAAALLQQMLGAGISAEHALRSLNSLAILRELGGCSTVDLVQLQLDSGRAELYKWGAAGSCLIQNGRLRRLGCAMPPPGLSRQNRESVEHASLGRGEVLILHSDGAAEDGLLRLPDREMEAGELAAWLLEQSGDSRDDATVAVVRLLPA